MAIPGPKPISSTRSVGCTSSNDTTQVLRRRFELRWVMTQPERWPPSPCGCMNWPTIRLPTCCFRFTNDSAREQ